jgi:hypothetical protein
MKRIHIYLLRIATILVVLFCLIAGLAMLAEVAPTPEHKAAPTDKIIPGLRVQDFPAPQDIWDKDITDHKVAELVATSALLWGLNQLKDHRIPAQDLTPLPEGVASIDAWKESARIVNMRLNDKYWWIEIELAEEWLGITDANVLPYGDRQEEAYALREIFPDLYVRYLAQHK